MTRKKQRWTAAEERRLLQLIESQPTQSLNACFITFSQESGRSQTSVSHHYYQSMRSQTLPATPEEEHTSAPRKWTKEEDDTLLRYMDNMGIGNLSHVFITTGEQIGRTKGAVAAHWYAVLSKKPEVRMWVRASKNDALWNRKNGVGVPSNLSIWRRVLRILKNL